MTRRNRSAEDIGRDSPSNRTASEQGAAGAASGPQEAREAPRVSKQPAQTSGRRSAQHQQPPTARKSYEPEEDPNQQGEGEPSPHVLKERSSMQGFGGRGTRGRKGGDESVTEQSHGGEPAGGHTGQDRQHIPGDRDPQQPA